MMLGRRLETSSDIDALLATTHRVAVLGMKTEAQKSQPAFSVALYLHNVGIEIIPVPVYYPDITKILELQVFRRVADVPGAIDIVDVFRRPEDVPQHIDDILSKRPRAVWLQLGIRNELAAERLTRAGIDVVQDRCILVDHRRWISAR